MNNCHPVSSPTLWLAAGMGLVLGLVCLQLGADDGVGRWLVSAFQENGFPELDILPKSSPMPLIALVISSFGIVLGIGGTLGAGRRMMLLVSALVVFAMACPVLALWGIFWNPFALLISVLWAGVLAMVHANHQDKLEAVRIANEQKVVPMNPPVSPS